MSNFIYGALAAGVFLAVWRWRPKGDAALVSVEWLTDHAQRARDEFDGPVWNWPVDKRFTENGWFNRYEETERRKSA